MLKFFYSYYDTYICIYITLRNHNENLSSFKNVRRSPSFNKPESSSDSESIILGLLRQSL
jgi:hypothetical protein